MTTEEILNQITELSRVWYIQIGDDHHKDRDCHFYINTVWSYGQRQKYRVEHFGYIFDDIEEEFDTYRAKKLPHPLLVENNIKAHLFPNQKLLNQWRNNFAGIRYFDQALEATLFGAVDDVLEFDDLKIAPLDYKSTGSTAAKIYDRFQLQLDTYTFLMEKNGFATTRKGYLAFYIVDKSRGFIDRLPFRKEVVEIDTNPSDIYAIFNDAVNVLRQANPPPHNADCPFGKWLNGARSFSN